LAELWGKDGRQVVSEFCVKKVLPGGPARRRLSEAGVKKGCCDPQLRLVSNFAPFVKKLHKAGLLDFVSAAEEMCEEVEPFFVKKKGGKKLRLVLDCRRPNCWFRLPDSVSLATGDALGRIELKPGEELYISSADLKDAFYHLELPVALTLFLSP
jgi:hypothetical protein